MSTLSVPLTPSLEAFITSMVAKGYADNKAQVVRKAIAQMAEDEAVEAVLCAEQEIWEGKVLYGDLDTLAKKLRHNDR